MEKSTVNHPPHYNQHPSGIECIDVVQEFNFNLGNVIKYIWRARFKSDDPLEDLKKAKWYIEYEIARIQAEEAREVTGNPNARRLIRATPES